MFLFAQKSYQWIKNIDPDIPVPIYTTVSGRGQKYGPGCGLCFRKRSDNGYVCYVEELTE
jgi:hypothetical protein